ncbi:DUF1561 family protein [Helicobacter himalayensis]|uniref:DUF1561 family protein n=1 Tax=Helicobacter himalayensis TaxID=1591088 RepID=UPI003D6F576D
MRSLVSRLYTLVFLFFSLCVFSSAFATNTQQVPQNLANKPKDRPIAFKSKPDSLVQCLTPIFTRSEGYVGVSDCDKAIDARYDVFSRIAWKLPDTWVCLSAENEEYIQGKRLVLRPCVIDDKTQSFTIKNNMLYTPDLRFVVQISNGFLTLEKSQSKGAESHFTLHNMQEWLNTIATPAPLMQKSFIAWKFITPQSFDVYYLRNDESIKDKPQDLYFNLENGIIAQYEPSNAKMSCLTSKQKAKESWNWVAWEECLPQNLQENKAVSSQLNAQNWSLFMLADNDRAMLKDYLGNFLRISKYGVHWGVPYTARADFLAKDINNDQTSYFQLTHSMQDWERFKNANLADSLPFCPANGSPQRNVKAIMQLPPSFVLTQEWKRRLWQIATTTDGVLERAGDCGVCLLQSYQMIAEMNEYTTTPLQSGGFFFDTAFGRNPFPSFRARYPMLATSLEQYRASHIPPGLSRSATFEYAAQMYRAIALSLFPGHFWLPSEFATSDITIRSALRDLFEQPVGTLWVMQMYYIARDGSLSGHGMPVLRTSNGIQFIPTNLPNVSYESYEQALSHSFAHNLMDAYNVLTRNRTLNLYMLYSLRLREIYPNPINAFLSNNNCSGEGEERRGSRNMPLSGLINQCASGRCVLQ